MSIIDISTITINFKSIRKEYYQLTMSFLSGLNSLTNWLTGKENIGWSVSPPIPNSVLSVGVQRRTFKELGLYAGVELKGLLRAWYIADLSYTCTANNELIKWESCF